MSPAKENTTVAKLPVRLRETQHRLPEQGLIKFGVKGPPKVSKRTGKTYQEPEAIPWFRFCSQDRGALAQIAAQYGGTVEPWQNGYGRPWAQVVTETSEIRVVLPKDPLGDGPIYERWKGGGCERRCDGEICTIPRGMGGPDPEPIELDCLCAAEGALSCKPHTRLKVMLPGLDPFIGVWRLEAKGDHAAKELPGMVALVFEAQERGMAFGILRLEQRSEYGFNEKTGKRELHHYVTPVVGVAASFDALLAGGAKAVSLPSAAAPLALSPHHFDPSEELVDERDDGTGNHHDYVGAQMADFANDDIVDAEIVEDAMSGLEEEVMPVGDAAVSTEPGSSPHDEDPGDPDTEIVEAEKRTLRQRIAMDLGNDDVRHALARQVSHGRTDSTRQLTLEELRLLAKRAQRVREGKVRVTVIDGEAKVERT